MFAGRIQPLEGARRAAARRTLPARARPVPAVAGSSSPSSAARRAAASSTPSRWPSSPTSLGIADVVRFVPPVAQSVLADWYAAATLVCVPSYNESFGLVAVEAQAAGTPVVAAAVGGLTTVVRDGVSGLLVEGHDPADYARAMERIIAAPDLRAELSRGRGASGGAASPGSAPPTARSRSTAPPPARCATTSPGSADERARRQRARDRARDARRRPTWPGRRSPTGVFTVELPGEKKLSTPCRLDVGEHAFGVHAFVVPAARREPRAGLPLAARAQPEDVRRLVRRRRASATSTSTAGCRWSRSPPTRSTGCSARC